MAELSGMTERDLLISLNQKVEGIEKHLDGFTERVHKLETRMTELEAKIKIWAGMAAAFGSVAMSLLHKFLNF